MSNWGSELRVLAKQMARYPQRAITALAGAGLSAASGIPTFRGKEGWWKNREPAELASPQGFNSDPRLVWEWYCHRIETVLSSQPNAAHEALATLDQIGALDLLITQNVDGLHRRSGISRCIEIHGSILRTKCTGCKQIRTITSSPCRSARDGLPRCECGELLRPDVVWFGEALAPDSIYKAYGASQRCMAMLVVGTSGVVHPAASFPEVVHQSGNLVIEFNIEKTPISRYADHSIIGPVEKTLPKLIEFMEQFGGTTQL